MTQMIKFCHFYAYNFSNGDELLSGCTRTRKLTILHDLQIEGNELEEVTTLYVSTV